MSLACRQLNISIGGKSVVRGLEVAFQSGQFWGVLGCNGSGKTTLLHTLAALREAESGSITFAAEEIGQMRRQLLARKLGLLLQHTAYVFDATVLQTALIGRHPYLGHWQQETAADIELARRALRQTGLLELEHRNVTSLSGGESRRLAFATLLVQDPRVMLLDEPSNHLDLHHQNLVMAQLKAASGDGGKVVVAALHDVNLAARFCSHVLLLYGDGEYEAGASQDLLDAGRLSRLYHHRVSQVSSEHGPLFYSHPVAGEVNPESAPGGSN